MSEARKITLKLEVNFKVYHIEFEHPLADGSSFFFVKSQSSLGILLSFDDFFFDFMNNISLRGLKVNKKPENLQYGQNG